MPVVFIIPLALSGLHMDSDASWHPYPKVPLCRVGRYPQWLQPLHAYIVHAQRQNQPPQYVTLGHWYVPALGCVISWLPHLKMGNEDFPY